MPGRVLGCTGVGDKQEGRVRKAERGEGAPSPTGYCRVEPPDTTCAPEPGVNPKPEVYTKTHMRYKPETRNPRPT